MLKKRAREDGVGIPRPEANGWDVTTRVVREYEDAIPNARVQMNGSRHEEPFVTWSETRRNEPVVISE
jgi:hypothetical protein